VEAATAIRGVPHREDDRLTTYGGDEDIARVGGRVLAYLTKDVLHDEL